MLGPRDRQLLLDALRPPSGYALDRAIGTSFSLDLLALLAAPLAFTLFNWEDKDGRTTADPLALLEALRRHANRIRLFCQAGEIKLPPAAQPLIAYLEGAVVEARAPREGGIFHPKVWVLRFTTDGGTVRYRVVCLSRNLTFDRSWDTVLVLDGELTDRQRGYSSHRPLSDFVAALPDLAVRPLTPAEREPIQLMASELRRVQFETPEDVESLGFWPLGLSTRDQWPFFDSKRRLLILSPFLSASLLEQAIAGRSGSILISRPDQLAQIPAAILKQFAQVYALDPAAEELGSDEGEGATDPGLAGLHAKLYIEDNGWDAHVYTGSANATNSAFDRNVEFLVELRGKRSRFGIDELLTTENGKAASFLALLRPWSLDPNQDPKGDPDAATLEQRLAAMKCDVASLPLRIRVRSDGNLHWLDVWSEDEVPKLGDGACRLWPSSLSGAAAVSPSTGKGVVASFGPVTLDAITSFMVFEISMRVGDQTGTVRFAANLPLLDAPVDRRERLLAALLRNQEQVRRLLWLLLQGEEEFLSETRDAMERGQAGERIAVVRVHAGRQVGTLGGTGRHAHRSDQRLDFGCGHGHGQASPINARRASTCFSAIAVRTSWRCSSSIQEGAAMIIPRCA